MTSYWLLLLPIYAPAARELTRDERPDSMIRARISHDEVQCIAQTRHPWRAQHRTAGFLSGIRQALGQRALRTSSGGEPGSKEVMVTCTFQM